MQFPIGIDPERFIQALETDQVKLHIKELRRFFAGRKVPLFPLNYYLSKFHI
jgi:trehalose 6-phosphate synthase/phosphatase